MPAPGSGAGRRSSARVVQAVGRGSCRAKKGIRCDAVKGTPEHGRPTPPAVRNWWLGRSLALPHPYRTPTAPLPHPYRTPTRPLRARAVRTRRVWPSDAHDMNGLVPGNPIAATFDETAAAAGGATAGAAGWAELASTVAPGPAAGAG